MDFITTQSNRIVGRQHEMQFYCINMAAIGMNNFMELT